ncbi:MAG: epsJ [Cryptosporangiaceae bacterium]|jgi:glycosyltransferase involved in cell wall biosynthesis|nr:epsJ [Cryptosporangiaceae bacterium]
MLTVVVLTYDSSRTVEACLDSLAAQDPPPDEILVVDDDSTDDTLTRVEAARRRHGLPLRTVRNGAHNISRGRNLGLDAATGDIVAFLDSDAVATPGWAAGLRSAFAADPDVAVVGGAVEAVHASAFAEAVALNDETVRDLFTRGELLVSGCNMALRPDLLGGERFDPSWVHAEDVEYVDRIGRTHRWAVTPGARVRHESRADPRGYLRQMYRYGLWKVRYTLTTGKVRPVDYVPTLVFLAALVLAPATPWALLGYPALAVAETVFVAGYRRAPARLWGRMLLGWLVKNTGWGAGVLVGLAERAALALSVRRRPAWAR